MISEIFGSINSVKFGNDGDGIDRLNHRHTTFILLFLAIFLGTSQYVTDPISCWVPAEFGGSWHTYTEQYCWIKNTYYVPIHEDIILEAELRKEDKHVIRYYQWIPIMLSICAIFFYLPRLIWRLVTQQVGIDMDNLITSVNKYEGAMSEKDRAQKMYHIAMFIDRYLDTQTGIGNPSGLSKIKSMVCSKKAANYMGVGYLAIKILYMVNIAAQLIIFSIFIGNGYSLFGLDMITKYLNNGWSYWNNNPIFPRITFCQFSVRNLAQITPYTVQCALPINLFNEKVFFFLWWWYLVLFFMTFVNLCLWCKRIFVNNEGVAYIKKHLRYSGKTIDEGDKRTAKLFVKKYLRPDGIFVIRLLARNTNSMITSQIVCALWEHFLENKDEELAQKGFLPFDDDDYSDDTASDDDSNEPNAPPLPAKDPLY